MSGAVKSRVFSRLFLPLAAVAAVAIATTVVANRGDEVEFRAVKDGPGIVLVAWQLGPDRVNYTGDTESFAGKSWSKTRPTKPGWLAIMTVRPVNARTIGSCQIRINRLLAPPPGGAKTGKPGEVVTCVAVVP